MRQRPKREFVAERRREGNGRRQRFLLSGDSRLLKIGEDGSLVQIPQHKVIHVQEAFGGTAEDRDLLPIGRGIERQDQSRRSPLGEQSTLGKSLRVVPCNNITTPTLFMGGRLAGTSPSLVVIRCTGLQAPRLYHRSRRLRRRIPRIQDAIPRQGAPRALPRLVCPLREW